MKYIFCDIDGVLTNGVKFYGIDGMPHYKTFYDKDFTALKELAAFGFKIIFITGDGRVNKEVIINRNYDIFVAKSADKVVTINENFNIRRQDTLICFGDDLFDLTMLEIASIPVCPSNSHSKIKSFCTNHPKGVITQAKGGEGVIQEFAELFFTKNKRPLLEKILLLDKEEKF